MFTMCIFKVFAVRMLFISRTISRRVDFPSKLKSLSVSCSHKSGSLKCLPLKPSHHLWSFQYPSWTLKGIDWGSSPQDGLQVFSLLVVVPAPKMDTKRLQLGVTTKDSFHAFLPPVIVSVPKLDPEKHQLGSWPQAGLQIIPWGIDKP